MAGEGGEGCSHHVGRPTNRGGRLTAPEVGEGDPSFFLKLAFIRFLRRNVNT